MRVLHIDTGATMHGGQWQVLHLLESLAQRGIESRLLAPAGSPLLQAARAAHCDARPLQLLGMAAEIRHFDLVHAHDARAHSFALLSHQPLVVSRRVAFPVKRTPFSWFKYRRPAQFLAVSQYVRNALIQAGVPVSKISVVHDGVHLPGLGPRVHHDRNAVIALDSDDPGKGKAILKKAARLANIPVHFSQALPSDLPGAALFVYITELEGLGSAALLAMSCGVPVLASRVGGLPEIIEHGVTGWLTGNHPEEVAQGIRLLHHDRVLALRLAQAGRTAVEQRFTVAHMVENTIRAYERVLSA